MDPLARELRWLRCVRDHAQLLATEPRLERLLPRILDSALDITEAERGYLVRVSPGEGPLDARCTVECAKGWTQRQLKGTAAAVSRTVVERVVSERRGLVTTREEDADVLDASSVRSRRVASIICVPLRVADAVKGVLYLDHHRSDAFREEDLAILRTFADQAAVAVEAAELRAPAAAAPPEAKPLRWGRLIGGSPAMRALYEAIARASRSREPLLLQGEAGSGKQLVARELHARSGGEGPLVIQGCSAASEEQLEVELCGRAGEAKGALVRAGQGVLVLDDVADLPPSVQGRLVAALRERTVTPVGGAAPVPLHCRVVAVTRHDLGARVREGSFREDLYYRLDALRLELPSLRERSEDVLPLVHHLAERLGGPALRFTENAAGLLTRYAWPGNVRELEGEVRRLVALDTEQVSARQLSERVRGGHGLSQGPEAGRTLGEVERDMVAQALEEAGGNKARAARQLGIPRSTLYGLIQRYGLGGEA